MNILVVTGRTGGHFYPALQFSEVMERKNSDLVVHKILSERVATELLENQLSDNDIKNCHVFPYFAWKGLFSLHFFVFSTSLIRAFFLSLKLINEIKPKLVVGFGSYLSFPVLLAARLKKIPTLIHEQNMVMGRANRLLSGWVDCVALSFRQTSSFKSVSKAVWTGNLIRFSSQAFPNKSSSKRNQKLNILVMGGSQGARGLNRMLLKALTQLGSIERRSIHVTHISGPSDLDAVKTEYSNLAVNAEVLSYSNGMSKLYLEADMVISRAGAGTLFELVHFKIPSILIPYPYAKAHQLENAIVLAERKAAWCIEESDTKIQELVDILKSVIQDPQQLMQMKKNIANSLKVDDGDTLSECALGLIDPKLVRLPKDSEVLSNNF